MMSLSNRYCDGYDGMAKMGWCRLVYLLPMATVLAAAMGWGSPCAAAEPDERAGAAQSAASASQIRYCNQKSILVRYRWEGAEPEGVQMWIQPDEHAWLPWYWTNQPQEPITFDAPRQGRLTMALGVAPQETAEAPGPTCQMLSVVFDWDKPLLRLVSARMLVVGTPLLRLGWAAWDENLGDRPISLYYRSGIDQAWQLAVRDLPNSGIYEWDIPANLAGKNVEANLRATDLAGNTAEVTVSVPVAATSTTAKVAVAPRIEPVAPHGAPPVPPPVAPAPKIAPAESVQPELPAPVQTASAVAEAPAPVAQEPEPATAPAVEKPPASQGPSTVSLEAERLSQLAQQQIAKNNFEVAEDLLRQALEVDPTFYQARTQLGILLQRRGQWKQAIREYEAVLAIRPESALAWRNLALAHMTAKDYPKARVTLQKLLAIEANNPQTWLDLGDVEMLSSRPDVARQFWDKATSLSQPGSEVAAKAAKRLSAYGK